MRSGVVHLRCRAYMMRPDGPSSVMPGTPLPLLVILLLTLPRESTPVGAHNHTFPGGKSLLERRDTSGVLAPALSSGNTFHPRHRWWISGSHHIPCEHSRSILDRNAERSHRSRIAVAIRSFWASFSPLVAAAGAAGGAGAAKMTPKRSVRRPALCVYEALPGHRRRRGTQRGCVRRRARRG